MLNAAGYFTDRIESHTVIFPSGADDIGCHLGASRGVSVLIIWNQHWSYSVAPGVILV